MSSDSHIEALRKFNRFFTSHIDALNEKFLGSDLNLSEGRVLYEIGKQEPVTATHIQKTLNLDRGYLSRILSRFQKYCWITRDANEKDTRVHPISLTTEGRKVYHEQNKKQHDIVSNNLSRLDTVQQKDLVEALTTARLLLEICEGQEPTSTYSIRSFRPGDVSYIVSRQSKLYESSNGWGAGIELVETGQAATFLRQLNRDREECFVAELEGVIAGAIFITDEESVSHGTARIRMFYVEPFARRRGIGDALVQRCIDFATDRGFREIILWTQAVLKAARRLYARHGFEVTKQFVHEEFGTPVEGEMWRATLNSK